MKEFKTEWFDYNISNLHVILEEVEISSYEMGAYSRNGGADTRIKISMAEEDMVYLLLKKGDELHEFTEWDLEDALASSMADEMRKEIDKEILKSLGVDSCD